MTGLLLASEGVPNSLVLEKRFALAHASFVNLKCSNAGLGGKGVAVLSDQRRSLLTRQLLFDDETKRFDASLIAAGSRLDVLGPDSQHRSLKLNERYGRTDPDRGGGSDVLLLAGHAMDV
jgi:hypothetical protein